VPSSCQARASEQPRSSPRRALRACIGWLSAAPRLSRGGDRALRVRRPWHRRTCPRPRQRPDPLGRIQHLGTASRGDSCAGAGGVLLGRRPATVAGRKPEKNAGRRSPPSLPPQLGEPSRPQQIGHAHSWPALDGFIALTRLRSTDPPLRHLRRDATAAMKGRRAALWRDSRGRNQNSSASSAAARSGTGWLGSAPSSVTTAATKRVSTPSLLAHRRSIGRPADVPG
jgi:hypothetical protein